MPKELVNSMSSSQIRQTLEFLRVGWEKIAGTTNVDAKMEYLRILQEWDLFGSNIFAVEVRLILLFFLIYISNDENQEKFYLR
jgi:hypothetical protein